MEHARGVHAREAAQNLKRDLRQIVLAKRSYSLEPQIQALALEIFHDEVRLSRGQLADVEDANDVIATDRRTRARLVLEANHGVRVAAHVRPQDFDRDMRAERRVVREEDLPEAALADDASNLIAAVDEGAGLHRRHARSILFLARESSLERRVLTSEPRVGAEEDHVRRALVEVEPRAQLTDVHQDGAARNVVAKRVSQADHDVLFAFGDERPKVDERRCGGEIGLALYARHAHRRLGPLRHVGIRAEHRCDWKRVVRVRVEVSAKRDGCDP